MQYPLRQAVVFVWEAKKKKKKTVQTELFTRPTILP